MIYIIIVGFLFFVALTAIACRIEQGLCDWSCRAVPKKICLGMGGGGRGSYLGTSYY